MQINNNDQAVKLVRVTQGENLLHFWCKQCYTVNLLSELLTLSHSTMFSSISLSAEMSRIRRLVR